jgi:hypothetical protein
LAIIKSGIDNKGLQNELNVLKDWTDDRQIKFNSLKSKVMHFSKSNPNYKYTIDDVILEELKVEKDLGTISWYLEFLFQMILTGVII